MGPCRQALIVIFLLTIAAASAALEVPQLRGRVSDYANVLQPDQASALVTTGPNSISRNPMYVGMAGLLTAHAIWRGSWVALLPVAGFVVLIDRLQIEAEESALLAKFGTEFESYRAASPRWVGLRSLDSAK